MLYMLYGIDGPDGPAARERARQAHLDYLQKHKDKVVLGGATLPDTGDTRTGSVLIINVPDRPAADAFAKDEPLRMAGAFETYTVTRMRRGQWNPGSAPKSAEGD